MDAWPTRAIASYGVLRLGGAAPSARRAVAAIANTLSELKEPVLSAILMDDKDGF